MLPRVLNTFDMVAIFVSIVPFITNAAVIQSAGPAAFGWWVIALSVGGATIAYGAWFYLVAGIAALSLLVAVGIYFLGHLPRHAEDSRR
jgi:predicted permease